MSVELNRPQQGARAVTGADSPGKRAGKSGGATADVGNGFMALMNSLSSEELKSADLSAVPPQAGQEPGEKIGLTTVPDGLLIAAVPMLAPNNAEAGLPPVVLSAATLPQASAPLVANVPLLAVPDGAANVAAVVATPLEAGAPVQGGGPQRLAIHAGKGAATSAVDTTTPQKLASIAPGGVTTDLINASSPMLQEAGAPLPVNAWLAHRNAMQAQALSIAQQISKSHQEAALPALTLGVADVVAAWVMGEGGTPTRAQSRFGSGSNPGSSGLEGGFGGATTATNRAEPAFEVPVTSSVVADTAVAETVSYWASQGVQTAELTLDGFGDSPVEVSILINGDQAQVDFRTDQTAVRQVIESATAQLKELLSNQGLQLTGVSVGSYGKGGGNGDERRQRHGAQQLKLVKNDLANSPVGQAANAAVGQSLDLFV
jgi:flagellar hook-length control protein FliK